MAFHRWYRATGDDGAPQVKYCRVMESTDCVDLSSVLDLADVTTGFWDEGKPRVIVGDECGRYIALERALIERSERDAWEMWAMDLADELGRLRKRIKRAARRAQESTLAQQRRRIDDAERDAIPWDAID